VVSLSRGDGTSKMVRLYEWFHAKFPTSIDCRPILVKNDLTTAGFTIVKEKRAVMWGLPVDIVLSNSLACHRLNRRIENHLSSTWDVSHATESTRRSMILPANLRRLAKRRR